MCTHRIGLEHVYWLARRFGDIQFLHDANKNLCREEMKGMFSAPLQMSQHFAIDYTEALSCYWHIVLALAMPFWRGLHLSEKTTMGVFHGVFVRLGFFNASLCPWVCYFVGRAHLCCYHRRICWTAGKQFMPRLNKTLVNSILPKAVLCIQLAS